MMEQDDIKRAVLLEWEEWNGDKASANAALLFYTHLSTDCHDIQFRYPGDPYQLIRAWLIEAGFIQDANANRRIGSS